MNVLVVDTSSWISYFRGDRHEDLELALSEGRVYLPPVVVAELLSGKMPAARKPELKSFLEQLPLCESEFEHWTRVGELRSALLGAGYSVSTPDAHVAQCALDLNGYLVSQDLIFSKIAKTAGLRLF